MFSEGQLYPESSDWVQKIRSAKNADEFLEALEFFLNLCDKPGANVGVTEDGRVYTLVGRVDWIGNNRIFVRPAEKCHEGRIHFHVAGPDVTGVAKGWIVQGKELRLDGKMKGPLEKQLRAWYEAEGRKKVVEMWNSFAAQLGRRTINNL